MVLIYASAGMVAMVGVCSLAVDWGRVQLAESELERAADACARYAVTGVTGVTALTRSFTNDSAFKVGSSQSLVLSGGNYYFNDVDISGSLTFTEAATIYCYGSFSMSGNATTSGSTPLNLTLVMCPAGNGSAPGGVAIGSSSDLYASIYAPQCNVTLSGAGDLYGSLVGLSASMTGSSAIQYDPALDPNNGAIGLAQ